MALDGTNIDDIDISSDLNGKDAVLPADDVGKAPLPASDDSKATKPAASETVSTTLRETISNALKGEQDTPGSVIPKAEEPAVPVQAAQQVLDGNGVAAVQAPQGFDPQVFSTLPAETQQYVARTMEYVAQREQQFQALLPVEQLIAPRVQAWALNGMTPAQAVNQLFALSDMASTDPAGFIQYFAQQQGIDLEELAFADDSNDVPPETRAIQQELAAVRQQLAERERNEQQTAHNNTIQEIISFADEKDPDGVLKRPYFAEMGDRVMPYLQAAIQQYPNAPRAQVLQQAYESACWALPDVRAKMQAAENAAREAEALQKSRERAAKAAQAGTGLTSGTPQHDTDVVDPSKMSLRDTIKYAMANTA